MLVAYVRDLENGTLKANQTPEIVSDTGTISVWDARAGYGQVVARQAVEWAIEAAKKHGVAVNGLRNAHHIGRVGHWAEQAAAQGLVSIHFTNVPRKRTETRALRGDDTWDAHVEHDAAASTWDRRRRSLRWSKSALAS